MAERRKLVMGNWKMNGTRAALPVINNIDGAAAGHPDVDIGLCLPATLIEPACAVVSVVMLGAQDCHEQTSGAYTGCLSVEMLREVGARAVIVGHSERRDYQHETSALVAAKARAALDGGLLTILCVGETAEERDAGAAEALVADQLRQSLPQGAVDGLVIAYEPVWAIGTGRVPTEGDIESMHRALRATLTDCLGEKAEGVRILYGGSVNAKNAATIFAVPAVDGALVGGASLTADAFLPIVAAAAQSH